MDTASTASEEASDVVDLVARSVADHFCGAVRVDHRHRAVHASAHGYANRALCVANTLDTRFAVASGTKGCTALVIMRLVEMRVLSLSTSLRSVLGPRLRHLDDAITVHHLLSHRSGIGDYIPEHHQRPDARLEVPQCTIESPDAIVALLAHVPMRARTDDEFRYNNAGYVLLAVIAERATGVSIDALIERLVLTPAGMSHSGMLVNDALPGDAATGYVERHGLVTNVHRVPNRGVGDGGLFCTVADVSALWLALSRGAIVDERSLTLMTAAHGVTERGNPYGYGFWLHPTSDALQLEGHDVGISFRSVHHPSASLTWTVVSNWTDGAWPLADQLADLIETDRPVPADPSDPSDPSDP